jgi:hypothetical protein
VHEDWSEDWMCTRIGLKIGLDVHEDWSEDVHEDGSSMTKCVKEDGVNCE